jgi:HEPN domain-containing protein
MGHATHRLVERCAEYDPRFSELLDVCRQLDQYYIPTRYPNGLPDGIPHDVYTRAQAEQAVEGTRTVLRAVTQRLESLREDG